MQFQIGNPVLHRHKYMGCVMYKSKDNWQETRTWLDGRGNLFPTFIGLWIAKTDLFKCHLININIGTHRMMDISLRWMDYWHRDMWCGWLKMYNVLDRDDLQGGAQDSSGKYFYTNLWRIIFDFWFFIFIFKYVIYQIAPPCTCNLYAFGTQNNWHNNNFTRRRRFLLLLLHFANQ